MILFFAIFHKWSQKSSNSIGFIRFFATRFCILQNCVFHWVYKAFRRFENALRKPSLGNAFLIILGPFFDFWAQKSSFSIGFIRYFASGIRHELFTDKRKGFLTFLAALGGRNGNLESWISQSPRKWSFWSLKNFWINSKA